MGSWRRAASPRRILIFREGMALERELALGKALARQGQGAQEDWAAGQAGARVQPPTGQGTMGK